MDIRVAHGRLRPAAGPLRRAIDYAFYDWTREMPTWKRVITWVGMLIQGYAIWAGITGSLIWPGTWPQGMAIFPAVLLVYLTGHVLMNAMVTSELVRKTQMEVDQNAAQQIQRTLIPQTVDEVPGYEVETFYQPFRDVGGDYFDVIALPGDQTLFAIADVSGKGVAAALLSANIQALIRSMAHGEPDVATMAGRINQHLSRYTPTERFATAVFVVLNRATGELTYVNAGHNAPIVSGARRTTLAATGLPLGLFDRSEYGTAKAAIPPGGALLLFTDGLSDSVAGDDAEASIRGAMVGSPAQIVSKLKALIRPKLLADDVTILLVKRKD